MNELPDLEPLENHSLLQLSRAVGLNDYKLKKGFRDLLVTTVFNYLNDLRMQYANQLLLNTSRSYSPLPMSLAIAKHTIFQPLLNVSLGIYRVS